MYLDYYYIILVVPTLIFAVYAQLKISSTFNKYNKLKNSRGYTAAMAARMILDSNGLQSVGIERVSGKLTDHYDPRSNVIRLSDSTYNSESCAAIGVAAHEAGHAMQYAEGYFPIKMKTAILPVTKIGSMAAFPLAFLGIVMSLEFLINIGIILFGAVVLFQVITLPIEYNASNRAVRTLDETAMLEGDELKGAKKVLGAAALTYVAATLTAVANMLRLLLIRNRN